MTWSAVGFVGGCSFPPDPLPVAVVPLIHDTAESQLVRAGAVAGLGYLKDRRAVEPLVALTASDLRYVAIEALGRIGDSCAMDRLIDLLQTDDPHMQYATVQALGAIGSPRALPFLRRRRETLGDDHWGQWVLAAVDRAIERIERLTSE